MKNKKIFIFLGIILIIGIAVYYFFFYDNSPEETMSPEEAIEQAIDDVVVDEPPVHIEKGQVLGIKDEKKEWLIEAEVISIAKDRESTIFEDIKQMVIFKEEEPHLTISAERCIANMQSKDMELNGNVVISNNDGDSLMGEKIFWHSEEQRLSSNNKVELQVEDKYIVAGGISTNMEMTQLELTDRVTVTMKLYKRHMGSGLNI
jgi:LPS export ABC transporter protein LptC